MMVRSFVLTVLLFASGVAHAAVILQVDVSDPMAVVFTTTAAFADNTVSNVPSTEGIVLPGFFSGNVGSLDDTFDSGAINVFDTTAGTTRLPMDQIFVGTLGILTPDDLRFYETNNGGFNMSFLDTETALTGSASHDLSALTGLPTLGTVGTVFAGTEDIIGQYRIVPEPSTALLLASGLIAMAMGRRRRAL